MVPGDHGNVGMESACRVLLARPVLFLLHTHPHLQQCRNRSLGKMEWVPVPTYRLRYLVIPNEDSLAGCQARELRHLDQLYLICATMVARMDT